MRKTMLEEEKKKRSLNIELATKEDELFTNKRTLDQEIEMRRESERALKRLQEEIDTIKQGSMALIKHFTTKDEGKLTERDALQIAEQKIEEIKIGREWESLNNEKALLQERESEVNKIESDLKVKEALIQKRAREYEMDKNLISRERGELD